MILVSSTFVPPDGIFKVQNALSMERTKATSSPSIAIAFSLSTALPLSAVAEVSSVFDDFSEITADS